MKQIRWVARTTLAAIVLSTAAMAPQAMAQGHMGHMGGRMARGTERHPHLVAALAALRAARRHLQEAERDFGGHRTKAVEHTEAAIQEVQLAMRSDRR